MVAHARKGHGASRVKGAESTRAAGKHRPSSCGGRVFIVLHRHVRLIMSNRSQRKGQGVCRSKADGGRRCPSGSAGTVASHHIMSKAVTPLPAGQRKASRAEAQARWAQAEGALSAAKAAIGPPSGNPSYLLLGPLSRQEQHARHGGDSSAYDEEVAQGRNMLIRLLVSHGDSPDTAAAKTETLAAAYATWSATSEA